MTTHNVCMGFAFVAVLCSLMSFVLSDDEVRWNWMSGDATVNQDSSAMIGSRSGGMVYKNQDTYDNYYVFGGSKYNSGTKSNILMNDIWTFHGEIFKQVFPGSEDKTSAPVPRQHGCGCGVSDAMFIVFGGIGSQEQFLGDTWVYSFLDNKWTQVENTPSSYNTSETVDVPSPRSEMGCWCTKEKLYLFGGKGPDHKTFGDMWELSLASLKWHPIRTKPERASPLVGEKAVFHLFPAPMARSGAATWWNNNKLYLFGGDAQYDGQTEGGLSTRGCLSDLWGYDVLSAAWSHMAGPVTPGQGGHFSYRRQHAKGNNPGCRRLASTFVDTHGDLWLFGGIGLDASQNTKNNVGEVSLGLLSDVWNFNMDQWCWAYMEGNVRADASTRIKADHNTYNTGNVPGGLYDTMFITAGNTLLIYGGKGIDRHGNHGLLGDHWMLDCHNLVVYHQTAYTSTIFLILFMMFVGLTCIATTFLYTRKYFWRGQSRQEEQGEFDAEYSMLSNQD